MQILRQKIFNLLKIVKEKREFRRNKKMHPRVRMHFLKFTVKKLI